MKNIIISIIKMVLNRNGFLSRKNKVSGIDQRCAIISNIVNPEKERWQRDVKYIINRWNITGGENRGKDRVKTVDMKLWLPRILSWHRNRAECETVGNLWSWTDIFEDVVNSFFGETSVSLRARFIISLLGMLLYYLEFRVELNNVWFHIFFLLTSQVTRKVYNLYLFFFFVSMVLFAIVIINLDNLKKRKRIAFKDTRRTSYYS